MGMELCAAAGTRREDKGDDGGCRERGIHFAERFSDNLLRPRPFRDAFRVVELRLLRRIGAVLPRCSGHACRLEGQLASFGHVGTVHAHQGRRRRNGSSLGQLALRANQSLQNAAYRLGDFGAHVFTGGPDDRLADNFGAPKMAMDSAPADRFLLLSRTLLALAMLALGIRLGRKPGNKLNVATGFALACVTMLAVSPVARAHYFLLLAPAILFVPLWLDRHGRPRAGVVMAAILPVLSVLHYVLLPYGGRVGLLGFGTTTWLMAAMVLLARADRVMVQAAQASSSSPADSKAILSRAA